MNHSKIICYFGILISTWSNLQAADLKTNYVVFNILAGNASIKHNETSPSANFSSLHEENKITTLSLHLGAEKEFFSDETLSFNLEVEGGGLIGQVSDNILDKGLQFKDQARGMHYGFGGTGNYNFTLYKMRTQVFGGLSILKGKTKYRLEYTPLAQDTPKINIDYIEDGTQTFLVSGMRFFDPRVNLFSVFVLKYELTSSFTNTAVAKINMQEVQLENPAIVEHRSWVISIGFGMIF